MIDTDKTISTKEAAEMLGFTRKHIIELIKAGHLEADRIGWEYLVDKASVEKYRKKVQGKDDARSTS